MIIKGVDVLPHGLINNVAEKFGESGEILADYVRWLVGRIRDLAPSPGYRPRLHFDLYGCAGSRSPPARTPTSTPSPRTWPSSAR